MPVAIDVSLTGASLTMGAALWPLLAGLSLVLWSKARAAAPVPARGRS